MSKRARDNLRNVPVSLLILEGYTEEVFYPIVRDKYLCGIRIERRNIKGQGNINKDVLGEIYKYVYNNRSDFVRAYCCIDSERNKVSATPLDLEFICNMTRDKKMVQLLSVDSILADPDIESWFFYDIEGIYEFLGAKKSKRNIKKYCNPWNLCKKDLQQLFQRFKKVYIPGQRATNFINNLDIEKIIAGCAELREGIELIKRQANNSTNHIFS